MATKGSQGTRALPRDIVIMTPFWQRVEVEMKQDPAARVTFVPEMEELLGKISEMDAAKVFQVCKRVPVWWDSLPSGLLAD